MRRLVDAPVAALLLIGVLLLGTAPTLPVLAQADLSLALSQNTTTPTRYSTYQVTAKLTNDGPAAATNVRVSLPAPAGTVFVGGDEGTASVGTFDAYYGRGWQIPRLGPGETATLTVNLFLRVPDAPDTYAEVVASDQPDPDSTPGNGRGLVREDDEAATGGSGGGGGGGGDIDLSPAIATTTAGARYEVTTVRLTLRNEGPATATGIRVDVPRPAGVVYTGGDEGRASAGTFRPYRGPRGEWTVPALAAGATATLDINYFQLAVDFPEVYAEVGAAAEPDVDSTPGNGGGRVTEDDEASTAQAPDPCTAVLERLEVGCDRVSGDRYFYDLDVRIVDPVDRDDSFRFTVSNSATARTSNIIGGTTSGIILGSVADFGTRTEVTVTITDKTDGCTYSRTVALPTCPPAPTCRLSAAVTNLRCDDNGTPADPSDDRYTGDVTVANPGNPGGTYSGSLPGASGTASLPYGTRVGVDLGPVAPATVPPLTIEIVFGDDAVAGCSQTVRVTPPTACSTGAPETAFADYCDTLSTVSAGVAAETEYAVETTDGEVSVFVDGEPAFPAIDVVAALGVAPVARDGPLTDCQRVGLASMRPTATGSPSSRRPT